MAVIYQHALVELWNIATGRSLGSLPNTDQIAGNRSVPSYKVVLSADGRRLVTPTDGGFIVWDVLSRHRLSRLVYHSGSAFPTSETSFSPDDRLLATIGTDGVVVLWRADNGRVIAREPTEPSPGYNASMAIPPAFSADSRMFVAAGNWDRSPGVWRTSDGIKVSNLTENLATVAFSPNAPLIVTSGAFVWDAESGRRLLTLRDPAQGLDAAAFTADGLQVIDPNNGEVFSCDVCGSVTRLMRLARERITRGFTATEKNRYLR